MNIISGSASINLARKLCNLLQATYLRTYIGTFEDGELKVQLLDNIDKGRVVIIQSTSTPVNNNLMELLLLTDTAKRAGADHITAIIPYLGYSRQDRKSVGHSPVSVQLIAALLEAAGITHVITVDLHSQQIEGFFNIPIKNLDPIELFIPFIKLLGKPTIISPDLGSITRASNLSLKLGLDMAIINKKRDNQNKCLMDVIIGNIEGKDCILIDDIIDTAETITKASELLIKKGALTVSAFVTHAVLSSRSQDLIQHSPISRIYITDTITQENLSSKFQVISVEMLLKKALDNYYN